MRKLIPCVYLLCFAAFANATTSITTAVVSGHWTLAGSPYKIYNDISINPGTSLIIDPGVEVVFQGAYEVFDNGGLMAAGTTAQPILFHVNDTTGWYVDTGYAGGWKGIQTAYTVFGIADTYRFQFCNVTNLKNGAIIFRAPLVKNCNFYNNKRSSLSVDSEFCYCNIYNNDIFGLFDVIGTFYIHDNQFHHNTHGAFYFGGGGFHTIENNILDSNTNMSNIITTTHSSNPYISGGVLYSHSVIKGNKIYSNSTLNVGAISCDGFADIIGNLLCNNQHIDSGSCGFGYGGGALRIQGDPGYPDSSFYIVENNIIANNYSADYGGGIVIVAAKSYIVNNQIINNKAQEGGAIYIMDDSSSIVIKNNIFYGNVGLPNTAINSPDIIARASAYFNLEYDHNWSQHSTAFDIDFSGSGTGYILLGDTTTNITGTTPGLASPTLTANVTENAIIADFSLLTTSPCINKGDSTGAFPLSADYAGNPRITSRIIDIGAYESLTGPWVLYNHDTPVQNPMHVYPNPANNLISVFTPGPKGAIQIQDITGRLIAEKHVTNTLTSFDIQSIPRGIYFVVWYDGSSTKTTQKIVVE